MIVFLYRPSPQIPEPSEEAAEKCYEAATRNVNMQSNQIAENLVDLTWIFTQTLFMGLNTILWSLSYPFIRRQHPIEEVKVHLDVALNAINHTSERWPGVQSALQLYQNLIQGCLKVYSGDASYIARSPPLTLEESSLSSRAPSYSPASSFPPSLGAPRSPLSPRESHGESQVGYQNDVHSSPEQANSSTLSHSSEHSFHTLQTQEQDDHHLLRSSFQQPSTPSEQNTQSISHFELPTLEDYGMPTFDPNSVNNEFPSTIPGLPHWDPNLPIHSSEPAFAGYNDVTMEIRPWLGSFGEEYSRYMNHAYFPPEERMQTLSEQQQHDLMAELEKAQLPDVSGLISDTTTFYTGNVL